MQGTILKYDKNTHAGYISGYDGNRYEFTQADFIKKTTPKEKEIVDFDIDESKENKATSLIMVQTFVDKKSNETSSLPALAFILGVSTLVYANSALPDGVTKNEISSVGLLVSISLIIGILGTIGQKKGRIWAIIGVALTCWSLFIIT